MIFNQNDETYQLDATIMTYSHKLLCWHSELNIEQNQLTYHTMQRTT